VPYKHAFSRLYPVSALGNRPLASAFTLQADGRLAIDLNGQQELIDLLNAKAAYPQSSPVITEQTTDRAITPDRRFGVQVVVQPFGTAQEYWLHHIDRATGRSRRIRLSTEFRPHTPRTPRVAVSPRGYFFIVDDDGTVRLFTAQHLTAVGVFQVAHSSTENRIVSLAISAQETLLVGLSSWKDIVLYNIVERRLVFIRQIRDQVGWYDQGPGLIALAGEGEAVVTIGIGHPHHTPLEDPPMISVNGFRFVALPSAG
jgi:hypothetical protein